MYVIRGSVSNQRNSTLRTDRSSKIFIQSCAHLFTKPSLTILCGKDEMVKQVCVGMGHFNLLAPRSTRYQYCPSPPSGFGCFPALDPRVRGLTPWLYSV